MVTGIHLSTVSFHTVSNHASNASANPTKTQNGLDQHFDPLNYMPDRIIVPCKETRCHKPQLERFWPPVPLWTC
jgi:hypothetical protein